MGNKILGADIGGTNVRLGLIEFGKKPKLTAVKRYPTQTKADLISAINHFLKENKAKPRLGCFSVAGLVKGNKVKMTNSPIVLNSKEFAKKTMLGEVYLVNDLEAAAHMIPYLKKKDLLTLNKGKVLGENYAIVAAGTGLGKALLVADGSHTIVKSEGGHSDLPLLTEEELKLAEFIKKRRKAKVVDYEEVLSGRGLESIYAFLSGEELRAEEISRTRKCDPHSKKAFDMLVRFYARCCRNYVLDVVATGGLYLSGGVAAKNSDMFKSFYKEFIKNDRFSDLLKNVPIHIILEQKKQIGAACAYSN